MCVFESDEVSSTLVEDDSWVALAGLKSSPKRSKLSHFVVNLYCPLFAAEVKAEPAEEREPNFLHLERTVVSAICNSLAIR